MRANSAVCRAAGISNEELRQLSERESAALAYADAVATSNTVDADVFEAVRRHFSEAEMIELTATITWEICVAKFNRALEID
jgi:alkylhydroperoxidase family enzyme